MKVLDKFRQRGVDIQPEERNGSEENEESKGPGICAPRQNFHGKRCWVCDDYALPGVRPRDVRVCRSILEHEGELDDER